MNSHSGRSIHVIPTISVEMGCYNFASFIAEAIESVLAQTLKPYELIITDDDSSDNSWEIIEAYQKKYPDLIRAYRMEKNIGMKQCGVFRKKRLRGEFCTALDGDDRMLPRKLEMEWAALVNNPDADIAYSNVFTIDENGHRTGIWFEEGDPEPPTGDVFTKVFAKRFCPRNRSVFRNQLTSVSLLKEIGFIDFDKRLIHNDWDKKIRMTEKYKVAYSGEALVEYRNHGGGIHKLKGDKLYDSASYVVSKNFNLLRNRSKEELAFVVEGLNSLFVRLALLSNRTSAKQYRKDSLFPPRIIVNSLPESGQELVKNLIGMLPGIDHKKLHLGNEDQFLHTSENPVPLGAGERQRVLFDDLSDCISNLQAGDLISSHLPYSIKQDVYLQKNKVKMVLILRDPRDILISHTKRIAATETHPFNEYYAALNDAEQLSASITGASHNGLALPPIADRLHSILKWVGNPNVHVVKLEELFYTDKAGILSVDFVSLQKMASFLELVLDDTELREFAKEFLRIAKDLFDDQISTWRTDLNQDQLRIIDTQLGGKLREMGYAPVFPEVHNISQAVAPAKKPLNEENLIFLISQPRSGSTLLQRVLGAHQDIFTLAEPWAMLHPLYALRKQGIQTEYSARYAREGLEEFVASMPGGIKDYYEGIRAMASVWYGQALAESGKRMFLDKTPRYYNIIPELAEVFPNASVILLFRNPLAVLSSVLKTWVRKDWNRLQQHREDLLRAPGLLVDSLEQLGNRVTVINYEQFVKNPAHEIRKICTEIGITYTADMLNYGLKPAPRGRMGDNVGIVQHTKPEKVSLDKWKTTFGDPLYRLLGEIVLTLTGPRVIQGMGYDYETLLSELRGIPLNHPDLQQKEIVAMVSALQLTKESLQSIEHLFTPYLQNTMQPVY